MRISFVILHYMTTLETVQCVDSIKSKIDVSDFSIVIVDNASPNGSGALLQKNYSNDSMVSVLINEKNLGFSNGNNVGYQYAKFVLKSDFIVLLNNDTYLIQDDFFNVIMEEYALSKFYVLGPRVITPNSSLNTNPVRSSLRSELEVEQMISHYKKSLLLYEIHFEKIFPRMKNFLLRITSKKFGGANQQLDTMNADIRHENVQLHGCCLVFSPLYVERFNGLDSRTFMFLEEDVLFTQMQKLKLLMVYSPLLKIYHLEDVSTDSVYLKSRQKSIFILKNSILSAKVLLSVIRNSSSPETNKYYS